MNEIESVVDTILATKKTEIAKVDTSDIPQVSHPKKNLTISSYDFVSISSNSSNLL
jgi:hypothetical protein